MNIGHSVGKLDTELKVVYQFPHLVGILYPNLNKRFNGGQIVHRLKRRSPIYPLGGEIIHQSISVGKLYTDLNNSLQRLHLVGKLDSE